MSKTAPASSGATHSSIAEPITTTLAELMQRYLDGDVRAYGLLYRRVARRVRAQIATRIGRCDDVEDLVQATFLRGHAARSGYRVQPGSDGDAPAAWFCAIARNVALNHMRGHYREPARIGASDEPAIDDTPGRLVDPAEAIEAKSTHRARRRALHVAMEKLPAGQRDVVRLCGIEGLPSRTVAHRLGLRDVAVRVRTHRAIKNLRAWLTTAEGAHAA